MKSTAHNIQPAIAEECALIRLHIEHTHTADGHKNVLILDKSTNIHVQEWHAYYVIRKYEVREKEHKAKLKLKTASTEKSTGVANKRKIENENSNFGCIRCTCTHVWWLVSFGAVYRLNYAPWNKSNCPKFGSVFFSLLFAVWLHFHSHKMFGWDG